MIPISFRAERHVVYVIFPVIEVRLPNTIANETWFVSKDVLCSPVGQVAQQLNGIASLRHSHLRAVDILPDILVVHHIVATDHQLKFNTLSNFTLPPE